MRWVVVAGIMVLLSSWNVPAGFFVDGRVDIMPSDTLHVDTLVAKETVGFFGLAEDSLKKLALDIVRPQQDSARLANNALFASYLLEVVNEEGSLHYPFDSLVTISMLQPPDSSFRIITWYVPLQEEGFRYFGYIQTAGPSHANQTFYVLEEDVGIHDDKPDSLFTHERWLGTYYYDLIANTHEGCEHYVLLGWRADDPLTRKRIIEPFALGEDGPVFGAQVFDLSTKNSVRDQAGLARANAMRLVSPEGNDRKQYALYPEPLSDLEEPYRIVFTYSSRVSMSLLYDKQSPGGSSESWPMIVFDRLVPMQEDMKGQYRYYVPAGDIFDALVFRDGIWMLQADIDARNKKQGDSQ